MKRNRRSSAPLALVGALGALILFSAYVVKTGVNRQIESWDSQDFPILIEIWDGFNDGLPQIQTGSDPRGALLKALDCWVKISSLSLRAGETSILEGVGDGRNVVTIADTTNNRNIVGGALGVSRTRFTLPDLRDVETDVIFNPARTFTTLEPDDPQSDLVDLLAVAKHEFGHSWNLGHTIQRSSTMFFAGPQFTNSFDALQWDDLAGINTTYPMVGFDQVTGTISGTVTRDGSPQLAGPTTVFGAFVVATDEFGVLVASAISLPDGTYRLEGLPSGHQYTLYAEPLDGPMTPGSVTGGIYSSAAMDTNFLPTFRPGTVAVNSNITGVDIAVATGNSTIDPGFIGTSDQLFGQFLVFGTEDASQGANTNLIVAGTGFSSLDDNGVDFLGPNLNAGTVALTLDGFGKFFPLTVPLDTPQGPYSVLLQGNSETNVMTGALSIVPPFRFLQAFAQFAHVAGTLSSGMFLINTDRQNQASGKISARGANGARTRITLGSLAADTNQDLNLALAPGAALSATTRGASTFVGSLRALADQCIGEQCCLPGTPALPALDPVTPAA